MDIDFSILNGIFSKITDIKDNLSSTDTNKPLSAKQGKILNETKISAEDYLYIDTVDATITYDDDSTDTIPILADIRNVDGVKKVVIIWNDSNNTDNKRPSSVTVRLYRDGVEIDSYAFSDDNNWQKKVTVPVADGQGNLYSYTWGVDGIASYFSRPDYDGNLCIVTITLIDSGSGVPPSTPGSEEDVPIPDSGEDVPGRT